MCTTISDEIILCTCEVKNVNKLKNFWLLHRYDSDNGKILMGIVYNFFESENALGLQNQVILCNKLNEGILFDKPMKFYDNDRLQIQIQFKNFPNFVSYGFEYKNGIWSVIEYDYFSWSSMHVPMESGKIKNTIKK